MRGNASEIIALASLWDIEANAYESSRPRGVDTTDTVEAARDAAAALPMFTEIEGEWDEVMRVVKDATFALAEKGIRTEVILKADVRPGRTNMMSRKVAAVNEILEQGE